MTGYRESINTQKGFFVKKYFNWRNFREVKKSWNKNFRESFLSRILRELIFDCNTLFWIQAISSKVEEEKYLFIFV